MDPLNVLICGKRLLNADDVRRIQRLNIADPDHRRISREDIRVDLAHFLQCLIILRRDITVIPEIIGLYDVDHLLHDPVVVACSLDLDIQIQNILVAGGKFDDLIQCRNFGPRILFFEEAPVVKVLDLVICDFPYILVEPCRSRKIVVVHHDDRAILEHLHIQLCGRVIFVDALLKSRQRVLRRRCGISAVRHDHRQSVIGVEHPADLGISPGNREEYANRTERDHEPFQDRISVKIVRRIRVAADLLSKLLFSAVICRLETCHHDGRQKP